MNINNQVTKSVRNLLNNLKYINRKSKDSKIDTFNGKVAGPEKIYVNL